jgi:uncharacterized protein (TIGR02270 family)
VREHAENAAFDWLLRDQAVVDPAYYLHEIDELEEYVEAHLDGLRIAGDAGLDAVRVQLEEQGEAGEVFVAATSALEREAAADFDAALEIAESDLDASRGLVAALAWQPAARAEPWVRELLASGPEARRVGLRAAAAQALPLGNEIYESVSADAPALRAAALRTTGELALRELGLALNEATSDDDPDCRFWSAWSLALLDLSVDPLLEIASGDSEYAEWAVPLALRRLPPSAAHTWIEARATDPETVRVAILGAGACGLPSWVPWLIECTAQPDLARLSAEAFATIAGADIDEDHLDGDAPDGQDDEDDGSDEIAAGRDANLEWPDHDKIALWWAEKSGSFRAEVRYLWGAPIDVAGVSRALVEARQTVRLAAALELCRLDGGRPLFAARAPVARQRSLLGLANP